jgi:hypothetical protein
MAIGALLGSIDLAPAPAFDHGHDRSLHAIPMAPRHINASPTPGTRSCIARVELGDVLSWSTTPHDAEVEVCVEDRRLANRHANVVQVPGRVYVYVPPTDQVIVHLHIDPSDEPPPEAEVPLP